MLGGVGEGGVAAHLVLARGADHGEIGRERADRDIEAHLVVALAGATMCDRGRANGASPVDQQLGDQRASEGRRQRVFTLVERVRLEGGEHEVVEEVLLRVDHLDLDGAGLIAARASTLDVRQVAEVHRQAVHLVTVGLLQPLAGD